MTTELTADDAEELIREKVAELGDTAAEIAASLQRLGIKGRCGGMRSCPLYNYLRSLFGDLIAFVDTGGVGIAGGGWVDLPDVIGEFVNAFDRGHFPALIEAVSE